MEAAARVKSETKDAQGNRMNGETALPLSARSEAEGGGSCRKNPRK